MLVRVRFTGEGQPAELLRWPLSISSSPATQRKGGLPDMTGRAGVWPVGQRVLYVRAVVLLAPLTMR